MTASFKDSFDSYLSAKRDYACYLESKGYREEGDYTVWEPGEDNDEPTLGYEEQEEPDLVAGSEEMTLVLPDGTSYVHYYTKCAEF